MTLSMPAPISSHPQSVLCEVYLPLREFPGIYFIGLFLWLRESFAASRSLLNFFSSNTPVAQHGLISFIEQQIEVSKVLASAKDYRYWVLTLVQNLVSLHSSGFNVDNIEVRLRDLCNFLLGQQFPRTRSESISTLATSSTPLHASKRSQCAPSNGLNSSKVVPGLAKHDLLRDVLSVLASNLSLQRLYIEFKEQLDLFSPNNISLNSTYLSSTSTTTRVQQQSQTIIT